jgi:dihydropteroate synthase
LVDLPGLSGRTFVMGVLNVTPDSFSRDGIYHSPDRAAAAALAIQSDGADLLDIGGESTRPGYARVPEAEELVRVLPVIRAVAGRISIPISVDTGKASVARAAIEVGARVINDVHGLRDPDMASVAAETGASLVLVHSTGVPPGSDIVDAVRSGLASLVERAERAGVERDKLIVDPGLGMGKGWKENFEILRRLADLKVLDLPILVGPSRKGMIGKVLKVEVDDRLEGTIALAVFSVVRGADIVRVHDVRPLVRALRMTDAIVRPGVL